MNIKVTAFTESKKLYYTQIMDVDKGKTESEPSSPAGYISVMFKGFFSAFAIHTKIPCAGQYFVSESG